MKQHNTLIVVLGGIAALAIGYVAITDLTGAGSAAVPIQEEFDSKVVYTTNLGTDREPLIEDCNERDGVFNECGSVCAPDAEVCQEACAFTCDLE